jgi:hypothetical protein
MLNRSKLWAATLLLGVFAAGIAVGGPAWNEFNYDRSDERSRRGDSSESRDRRHKSYSERLQEELVLTAEQRTAVEAILERRQSEMREAWRQMNTQIDTLRQHISNEIMAVLDEGQQEKYRELLAHSRRRGDRERAPRENRNHE